MQLDSTILCWRCCGWLKQGSPTSAGLMLQPVLPWLSPEHSPLSQSALTLCGGARASEAAVERGGLEAEEGSVRGSLRRSEYRAPPPRFLLGSLSPSSPGCSGSGQRVWRQPRGERGQGLQGSWGALPQCSRTAAGDMPAEEERAAAPSASQKSTGAAVLPPEGPGRAQGWASRPGRDTRPGTGPAPAGAAASAAGSGPGRGAPMAPRAAPPRFGPLQLALAAAGTAAATLDLCMDGWVAAGYARSGHPGWAALSLSLLAVASAAAQACSWLWLRSDPPALRPSMPVALLAALHLLQLGFFFRYGSPAPCYPRVPEHPRAPAPPQLPPGCPTLCSLLSAPPGTRGWG